MKKTSESSTNNDSTGTTKEFEHIVGDGKGVFLSDMDEAEYETYDREENKGWKGFYKRVFNIEK